MQSVASIKEGYWYARSAEFMQTDIMHFLRWMRVPGDILLALGELLLVIFIIGLKFGWSLKRKDKRTELNLQSRNALKIL